jgi:hypothetical protein
MRTPKCSCQNEKSRCFRLCRCFSTSLCQCTSARPVKGANRSKKQASERRSVGASEPLIGRGYEVFGVAIEAPFACVPCAVCFEPGADHAYIQCRHLCVCWRCARRQRASFALDASLVVRCPSCNEQAESCDAPRRSDLVVHPAPNKERSKSLLCVACLESVADHAYFPCRRFCGCESCSRRSPNNASRGSIPDRCPPCDSDAESCQRMYF